MFTTTSSDVIDLLSRSASPQSADPEPREVVKPVPVRFSFWAEQHVGISISDHMYRMAVLTMCVSDRSLDIAK
jgi:hypothetical protein